MFYASRTAQARLAKEEQNRGDQSSQDMMVPLSQLVARTGQVAVQATSGIRLCDTNCLLDLYFL